MAEERLFRVEEDKTHIALRWGTSANPKLSAELGRPVFDKVLIGRLIMPASSIIGGGAPKSEFECVILRDYAAPTANDPGKFIRKHCEPYWTKYRNQAEQFMKSDEGGDLQGTPIEKWAMIDSALAATLKAMQVYTVEMLAALEGVGIQRLGMGGQSLVLKARNWLEASKDTAIISRITAEGEKKDAQIADLQRQLMELAARVQEQEDRKVDGRTREGRALRQRDEAA